MDEGVSAVLSGGAERWVGSPGPFLLLPGGNTLDPWSLHSRRAGRPQRREKTGGGPRRADTWSRDWGQGLFSNQRRPQGRGDVSAKTWHCLHSRWGRWAPFSPLEAWYLGPYVRTGPWRGKLKWGRRGMEEGAGGAESH